MCYCQIDEMTPNFFDAQRPDGQEPADSVLKLRCWLVVAIVLNVTYQIY